MSLVPGCVSLSRHANNWSASAQKTRIFWLSKRNTHTADGGEVYLITLSGVVGALHWASLCRTHHSFVVFNVKLVWRCPKGFVAVLFALPDVVLFMWWWWWQCRCMIFNWRTFICPRCCCSGSHNVASALHNIQNTAANNICSLKRDEKWILRTR